MRVYIRYKTLEPVKEGESRIKSRTYETKNITSNSVGLDIETDDKKYDVYLHEQIILLQIME